MAVDDEADDEAVADVQLTRALEVLKSWTYFDHLRGDGADPSLQARAAETTP